MKIKRLEVCGFKSFVDKTVVAFPDPITAIVGPNGCGKSNIVDAIRWCMGEQSAKHLRGRAMEDVIFAGSETRGPAGMAEVSLTFDARGLPLASAPGGVPWGEASPEEIVITRRLHRDGTSEYLLGGVPCRLRDIVDFFLGTGVGTKAYSIIEQGRVGFIVSSKPEDRRTLIDEAAGITKYKAKKRQAERRMESTRQHLLRVSDIIAEIEARLRTLRLQAQKAERFKRYKSELRDLDLWEASHRYLGYLADEKTSRAEHATASQEHDEKSRALAAGEAQVEADRLSLAHESAELHTLREEVIGLSNKAQLDAQRAQHYDAEAQGLLAQADDATREVGDLRNRIASNEHEAEDLGRRLASLTEDADRASRDEREQEIAYEALRSELAAARVRLDDLGRGLAEARACIARDEADLGSSEARRADLIGRLATATAEEASAAGRLSGLAGEATGFETHLSSIKEQQESLAARRSEGQRVVASLKERVAHGGVEIETLREEAHRRRSRLQSLGEIQARYESFERGVRAIMQKCKPAGHSGEPGGESGGDAGVEAPGTDVGVEAASGAWARGSSVRGLVADIVRPPPDLENAVEAVLGSRLGNIVVESHDVGVEAVRYLKDRSEGRSSFIPLTLRSPSGAAPLAGAGGGEVMYDAGEAVAAAGVPTPEAVAQAWPREKGVRGPLLELVGYDRQYDKVAAFLLGDVLVVEDLPTALDLWRGRGTGKTLVTLDGEMIDPHGVVTGGSRDGAQSGILGQKREIRDLEGLLAGIEDDLKEHTGRQVELRQELHDASADLERIESEIRAAEIAKLGSEKDLDRAGREKKDLEDRRRQLGAQIVELQTAAAEADTRALTLRERLERERAEAADGEGRSADVREQTRSLSERVDPMITRLTELKIVAAQAGDRRSNAEASLERVRREKAEQEERVERLDHGAREQRERAGVLGADATRLRAEAEVQLGLAEERNRHHAERQDVVEERGRELANREEEVRVLRSQVSLLAEAVAAHHLRGQEAELRRRGLEESVAERYRDTDLAAVMPEYHLRAMVGPAEHERMAQLRELIERMGEINLTAIEESEEHQKRFDFLTAQKADLEAAITQLEAAINKINRASRKRFQEVFEAVNAKFEEVFPRLFRGGKARLVLTNPDDLLETGVDIIANPPGKKIDQNLELLSGGEKALTAVSLLFAIFLVKPSPFCVLDEVDAPLDDVNVTRYSQGLLEMTDRSQFIVITHNKQTMEIADRLCGVTMEEPGVSKLVQVKLRGPDMGRGGIATQA